jgi:hypothetical protein
VPADRRVWWQDTPYVVRRPDAAPLRQVTGDELAVDVGPVLAAKVEAVSRYTTQVPFHFGSADAAGPALRAGRRRGPAQRARPSRRGCPGDDGRGERLRGLLSDLVRPAPGP